MFSNFSCEDLKVLQVVFSSFDKGDVSYDLCQANIDPEKYEEIRKNLEKNIYAKKKQKLETIIIRPYEFGIINLEGTPSPIEWINFPFQQEMEIRICKTAFTFWRIKVKGDGPGEIKESLDPINDPEYFLVVRKYRLLAYDFMKQCFIIIETGSEVVTALDAICEGNTTKISGPDALKWRFSFRNDSQNNEVRLKIESLEKFPWTDEIKEKGKQVLEKLGNPFDIIFDKKTKDKK